MRESLTRGQKESNEITSRSRRRLAEHLQRVAAGSTPRQLLQAQVDAGELDDLGPEFRPKSVEMIEDYAVINCQGGISAPVLKSLTELYGCSAERLQKHFTARVKFGLNPKVTERGIFIPWEKP